MATAALRFTGSESPSVDELAGGIPAQVNVLTDAAGAARLRPGISAWADFPVAIPNASPVMGIGYWNGYVIYVTADRKIWALAAPGYVIALSDATAATQLDGALRPVFAVTRTRIIIAGGGAPQKWEGLGLSARLGGSPPNFSHVVTMSQRVVGNDSGVSGLIYWSDIGDTGAETWETGLNFMEAETKQDPVTGLYTNTNELIAPGTQTIQMFSPDPSVTFSPAQTIEIGWGPPHSYVQLDQQFMGLDSRSRAFMCDGRSFSVVSSPAIGEQIGSIPDVSDCFGFRASFGNYELGVLAFPTDGRSFVYETNSQNWSQWHGYDRPRAQLGPMFIRSSFYLPSQRKTLVGLTTGQIAVLDKDAFTDLGDPIVVVMTTGFEDHGTSKQKKNDHMRFKFKRGVDAIGGTNVMLYSYRDDGGAFCEPFRIPIGDVTDVDPVMSMDSMGEYRVRQHKIVVDSVAFRLAGVEEDFVLLGN